MEGNKRKEKTSFEDIYNMYNYINMKYIAKKIVVVQAKRTAAGSNHPFLHNEYFIVEDLRNLGATLLLPVLICQEEYIPLMLKDLQTPCR